MAKKHNYQIGGFEAPRNSLELLADSFQSCYAVREYESCKYAVRQNMSKNNSFSANPSMKKLIRDEISKESSHKQRSPSIVARLMGMEVFPSDTESVGQPFKIKENTPEIGVMQRQYRDNLSTDKHMYNHLLTNETNLGKPRHRLHPQEKELQQFKKDFAAWQSSRFLECARVADLENISDMTKQKTVSYKKLAHQKPKKSRGLRTKSMDREFEEFSVMDFDKRLSKPHAPGKIVILKPAPESFSSNEESWASSSASVDDRDCIEDLLEEVKERIHYELKGKICRSGRDRKMQDSPEFTRQDSKQLLSRKLRSVLNAENHHKMMNYSSSSMDMDDTRGRLEQVRNILNARNGWENWNESNNGDYQEATSFRHDYTEEETSEGESSSPRNLMRSFSAPASGTSFGKLLLEDRHILTGAQVRRKHEEQKKERLKFSEKVSNIKCSLTLKGKLFSEKFHSFDLSHGNEYELIKDINSGPTVLLNLPERNENYTEVPPSPASVCSSTPEEPWQPVADHMSTMPTSDITSLEDQTTDREFKSDHNVLKSDLNRIDYEESEVTTITEEAETADLEDKSETYIRDLLVASGFYNGSSMDSSSILNPYEKLIDDQVFEKVEESYINSDEHEEDSNHKMLFDLLNEALSMVVKPVKTLTALPRPPQGRSLLQKVWTIISQLTYPSQEHDYPSLEDMVSDDLHVVPWFDLIDEELKLVSSDLGALITSEMIEEVIKDIAN